MLKWLLQHRSIHCGDPIRYPHHLIGTTLNLIYYHGANCLMLASAIYTSKRDNLVCLPVRDQDQPIEDHLFERTYTLLTDFETWWEQ